MGLCGLSGTTDFIARSLDTLNGGATDLAKVTRLDWLAKAGFAARGIVYILFGWIALSARGKTAQGQKAVFDKVQDLPLGDLLLSVLALGLCAYGIFRLASGLLDIERKGDAPKGLAGRAAQGGSGLFYLLLAFTAAQYLGGGKPSGGTTANGTSRAAARTLLDLNLSNAGLWLVALGFLVAAGLQVRKAMKGSHMRETAPDTPAFAKTLGQIGLVTRGSVFAVIAYSFVKVAQTSDPSQAKAAGAAIASLQRSSPMLYALVAAGLIVFGIFSLIMARYRVVPAIDVLGAATGKAREARTKVAARL